MFRSMSWLMSAMSVVSLLLAAATIKAETIVNIDFRAARDAGDVMNPAYNGVGPAGGGTTYNGVVADGRAASNGDVINDDLTLTASGLLDSNGNPTAIGFNLIHMGADMNTAYSDSASIGCLTGDYVWTQGSTTKTFTLSGLSGFASADIYIYMGAGRGFNGTVSGGTLTGWAGSGGFVSQPTWGTATQVEVGYFANVPITNGQITGEFGVGGIVTTYAGMTIVAHPIPEPNTSAIFGTGLLGLLAYACRRRR